MQKHSSVLVRLLAERGIDLTVIHPGGKDFSEEKLKEQFPESLKIRFIYVPFPTPGKIPGHYVRANKNYSKAAFKTVNHELADFDLVYAQGFTGHHFIQNKSLLFKGKILVNLHGFEMFQFAADFKTKLAYFSLRREAKFNLKNADYVFSFGGKLDTILKSLGIPENRILQQANGITEDWLVQKTKQHSVRTFVFIGRNERRKGLPELNKALSSITTQFPNEIKFHFIGKIDEVDRLNHRSIIYHGEIRETEKIISILDQCDCLVIPSYAEGMPTVILEAMARGLAIIGTNVGAVSRMIDGNGILIDRPDPDLVADALKKILDMNSTDLRILKQKSLDLVKEKFLWSKIVEDKISDFQKITGKEV